MSTTSIELEAPRPSTDRARQDSGAPPVLESLAPDVPSGGRDFSLPPADGGRDAWLFLAACFILEALVWGFPFAFGIFQDYYRTHEPFAGTGNTAVIGTCAMGIMYLDAPIVMALARLYPRYARYAPPAGLVVMCVSLAASSFSQTTTHLVATQGVLFAIGGSISYCPCILYMDEWFVRRKGLAFGVMWSGTGLGGCTIPLLLEFLLGRYGFRTTLRAWSLALFVLTIPLVFFIKPRVPPAATATAAHNRPGKLGFVLNRAFALYQVANVVEAAGFFLPGVYLPSYARSALGAGSFPAALTVLAVNVASVAGTVAMGALTDRLDVTTCILISTVGAVAGTFLLWGLATNLAVLYVFCVVYGVFAGAYTATWPGIMRQITVPPATEAAGGGGGGAAFDPVMVFGLLAAGRGVGNVVSGPLSEALVKGMPWQGQAAGGYGSGYGTLIAFTGTTAVVGGGSFFWKRLGWM